MKQKISMFILFGIDLLVVLFVIYATLTNAKDVFTVTFDLNGGVLVEGNIKQKVSYGKSVTPPTVIKDGAYLLEWSEPLQFITKDTTISAVWDYETSYGIQFEVYHNGNYCLVKGAYKEISGTVRIGSYYNGKRVLGIKAGAFQDCTRIKSVELSSGMYSIDSSAFKGCTSLESINLSDTLVKIGTNAFEGCTSLKTIEIPDPVVEIGQYAFSGCSNLVDIKLSSSLEQINDNVFDKCISLTNLTIGEKIEKIGYNAFDNLYALENIEVVSENEFYSSIDGVLYNKEQTQIIKYPIGRKETSFKIPDCVETIMANCFNNNDNLRKIILSNNLKEIQENAIINCDKIQYTPIGTSYYLGTADNPYYALVGVMDKDITEYNVNPDTRIISNLVFSECKNLKTIKFNNQLYSIGAKAFKNCNLLEKIELPNSLVYIGNRAFAECIGIEKIIIPNQIKIIEDGLFENCINLKEVTLPNGLEEIKIYAFLNCYNLSRIIIPETVSIIGAAVFKECASLESITIPQNVEYIGNSVLAGCKNLTTLVTPFIGEKMDESDKAYLGHFFGATKVSENSSKVPKALKNVSITNGTVIFKNAFSMCYYIEKIILPNTITEIGANCFNSCSNLKEVYFCGSVTEWAQITFLNAYSTPLYYNADIYFYDQKEGFHQISEIRLDEGLTSIGDYQFRYFDEITKIYVPNSVKEIGISAFDNCKKLTEIYMGTNLETIDKTAFINVPNLLKIEVAEANQNLRVIENNLYTFDGKKLLLVTNKKNLEQIAIPEGTEIIGEYAFYNFKSLEIVNLPTTLIEIQERAFSGDSSLSFIEIPYGVTSIGDYAFYYCSSLVSLNIPNTVLGAGDYAFAYCKKLQSVTLSYGLKKINYSAFYYCSSLAFITIPDNVMTIEAYAFTGCSNLKSVILNSKLNEIGTYAFSRCINLKEIFIPKNVEKIGNNAFASCKALKFNCEIDSKPTNWSDSWCPADSTVNWNQKQ